MNNFKEMKFWITDKLTYSIVCNVLTELGYIPHTNINANTCSIRARSNGLFEAYSSSQVSFDLLRVEEINVDWIQGAKVPTVELNGKTYLKADLEEALQKLTPL